jgi:hypothetical protein
VPQQLTTPTSTTLSTICMLCMWGAAGSKSFDTGRAGPVALDAHSRGAKLRGTDSTTATLQPPLHSGPRVRGMVVGPAGTCRLSGVECRG